jgi:hypothetical protein
MWPGRATKSARPATGARERAAFADSFNAGATRLSGPGQQGLTALGKGRHLCRRHQCNAMGSPMSPVVALDQHVGFPMDGFASGGQERRSLCRQLNHIGRIDLVEVARLQFNQRQAALAITVCPVNPGRDSDRSLRPKQPLCVRDPCGAQLIGKPGTRLSINTPAQPAASGDKRDSKQRSHDDQQIRHHAVFPRGNATPDDTTACGYAAIPRPRARCSWTGCPVRATCSDLPAVGTSGARDGRAPGPTSAMGEASCHSGARRQPTSHTRPSAPAERR